jgi:hypothetical protein
VFYCFEKVSAVKYKYNNIRFFDPHGVILLATANFMKSFESRVYAAFPTAKRGGTLFCRIKAGLGTFLITSPI